MAPFTDWPEYTTDSRRSRSVHQTRCWRRITSGVGTGGSRRYAHIHFISRRSESVGVVPVLVFAAPFLFPRGRLAWMMRIVLRDGCSAAYVDKTGCYRAAIACADVNRRM